MSLPRLKALFRGVEVWESSLDVSPLDLEAVLSPDELVLASDFSNPHLRMRFVARRAFRRQVLAAWLGCSPEEVVFEIDPLGKPVVAASSVRFSASSSGDQALLAISEADEVGVDIQRVELAGNPLREIRDSFAPEELAILDSQPLEDQTRLSVLAWVRKEAVAKAVGQGLGFDFSKLAVLMPETVERREFEITLDPRAVLEVADLDREGPTLSAVARLVPL